MRVRASVGTDPKLDVHRCADSKATNPETLAVVAGEG